VFVCIVLEKELYPIPGGECNSIMNYIMVIFWCLYALCLSILIWVTFEKDVGLNALYFVGYNT
jgi:uncharacterized iron-regulated membrane protein